MSTPDRTRTFTWQDPMLAASAAKEMSGLEFLLALQSGALPVPPIFALMGFAGIEVSEGHVVFSVAPAEFHYNPIGVVHGGVAATLLDSAMGCTIHSVLPRGMAYTTLELKVNYVRPMTTSTGIVRGEGTIIHRGGQVATAEGRVTDAAGKLYAHGTTTCLLWRI